MNKFYLIILCICLLAACKQKPVDDAVVDYAIGETLANLKYKAGEIKFAVEKNGNSEVDLNLLQHVDRVTSFKDKYLATNAVSDLLLYADSVNWAADAYAVMRINSKVVGQMQKSKDLVVQNPDSIDIKRLYFWTLKTEQSILGILSQQVGISCYFGPGPAKGYINKEDISPGDTVYITFGLEIQEDRLEEVLLGFENFSVSHQPSGSKVKFQVVNTKPYIIVRVIPQQKGDYVLQGSVRLKHFSGYMFPQDLAKSFQVK